jgi:hypothetical protein
MATPLGLELGFRNHDRQHYNSALSTPQHFFIRACLVGLDTAYLAKAALCLVVYGGATENRWSRSGSLESMLIVWPIVSELIWLLFQTFRTQAAQTRPRPS